MLAELQTELQRRCGALDDPQRAPPAPSILYLPPYSPDLNPIEQLFAKLEALLRKAAARTKDELWSIIGRPLATIPPAECARHLHHGDYGSTQVKMLSRFRQSGSGSGPVLLARSEADRPS